MIFNHPDNSYLSIDADFMRRLERLKIETRMILGGKMKGDKQSRKHGASVEFADYRDYHQGDDLRYLDWNIYARLNRFFLKLFHEEEDLNVYIFIDTSASMAAGEPPKILFAKQLALALSYICLSNLDRLYIYTFSSELSSTAPLPIRGKSSFPVVLNIMNNARAGGTTDFAKVMKEFSVRHQLRGLAFIISDLIDPVNLEEGLKRISFSGHDLLLIHILDKNEIEPSIRGDWALIDSESNEKVEVSISPRLILDYKRRLRAYIDAIKVKAKKLNAGYIFTSTEVSIEDFLLKELVRTDFLK